MIDKTLFIEGVVDNYPEKLLEGRVVIEGNLLACLFTDPTMYDDIQQQVRPDNFLSNDGRLLFGIIKFLREKKFAVIDEVTVLSNCSESVRDRLQGIGGWKKVQRLMSVVDAKNWDGIYDAFNKSNILLKLHRNGFALFKEITLENGKKVTPFNLFSLPGFDSASVLAWYEEFVSRLGVENSSSSSKVIEDKYVLFEDDFIDKLSEGAAAGVSFADAGVDIHGNKVTMFPFLSRNILGLSRATTTAIAAHSGCGKSTLMMNIVISLLASGLKGLFISNEMSLSDLKVIILLIVLTRYLGYWDITKQKLKSGNLNDADRAKIREASEYWKTNFGNSLKIVTMTDMDSVTMEQLIKKEALRNGIDFYVVDTFKISLSDSSANDKFWMDLVKDSRTLDSLAKKYNLIGLYTIQLAANSLGNLFLDASALSMSKAIKEVLSNLIMMRKVYPDEFAAGSPFDFKPFRSVQKEDGTWADEPYVIEEPDGVYRCITLDKTRSGTDSGDSGVCYLFKYKGDWAKFGETCKVRPVHRNIKQQSI